MVGAWGDGWLGRSSQQRPRSSFARGALAPATPQIVVPEGVALPQNALSLPVRQAADNALGHRSGVHVDGHVHVGLAVGPTAAVEDRRAVG